MAQEIADALNAGADLLEAKGWTQGANARDESGQPCDVDSFFAETFCTIGALSRVTENSDMADDSFERACAALSKYLNRNRVGGEMGVVASWNDTTGRTKREVIETLRLVAGAESLR